MRDQSMRGQSSGRSAARWRLTPLLLVVLAFVRPGEREELSSRSERLPLEDLEVRAAVLSRGATLVEGYYERSVAPVVAVLSTYHSDESFVREVSLALVREGRNAGVDPRVLTSIMLVENPWLDPSAMSFMGAVGLMQVMPMHSGRWGCESDDLLDVSANICHGARIFAAYLRKHDNNLDRALLAYNGCVSGTNTPNCQLYPSHVYSRAGRVAMSHWLAP
jgi:soluble lytic murein transglycosylase-like protein